MKTTTRNKTCPFCGAAVEVQPWHGGAPTKRLAGCSNENCHVRPMVTGETLMVALRRWNTRAELTND